MPQGPASLEQLCARRGSYVTCDQVGNGTACYCAGSKAPSAPPRVTWTHSANDKIPAYTPFDLSGQRTAAPKQTDAQSRCNTAFAQRSRANKCRTECASNDRSQACMNRCFDKSTKACVTNLSK